MKTNGFFLDKTSRKYECPECKQRTFVRFINEHNEMLPTEVGRCDREIKCGYFMTAKDYFKTTNTPVTTESSEAREITDYYYIPETSVKRLMEGNKFETSYITNLKEWTISDIPQNFTSNFTIYNYFVKYLVDNFGLTVEQIRNNMNKYNTFIELRPNTTAPTDEPQLIKDYGANLVQLPEKNIYFKFKVNYIYADIFNTYPTIREIVYNTDFHRIKDESKLTHLEYGNNTNMPRSTTGIRWCLFGEHLLKATEGKNCIVVESEKTAFVLSMIYPQFIWTATGGLNNLSTNYTFLNPAPKYFFLTDSGISPKGITPANIWKKRIPYTIYQSAEYVVIDLNQYCCPQQINEGFDILDLYLYDKNLTNKIINSLN